ncbi:AAA family ATPase [Bradyrhizobium sp. 27S5]|uniref:AAA family ATPase n=1 Tax=Bradyrhizobium sp. 27S5 TaxID=3139728 RepID=UPI0030CBD93B
MSTDDDYPNAFSYDTFDECAENAEKIWILKNAIALGEDSTWFGPPGCGKSALLLDMAFHIANRRYHWQWHEFMYNEEDPSREPRATVYFASERANLTHNRMGAYKTRYNPVPLPIAVVSETINLLDPACADQVVNTVLKFEGYTGCRVGLIIIDTFAKAIAAGNGDEDKALHQNMAATTLKRIHDRIDVHIATIGHTGKNAAAGERGSNARLGHVDLAVQVAEKGKVRTATVVKANDQPEGLIAAFQMEEVTVRRKWEDGTDREPYTTSILAPYDPDIFKREARPAVSKPTTGKQARALDALTRAIAERGQDGAVHLEFWKEELTRDGLIKRNDSNPRATFSRIRKSVQHLIEEPDDGQVRLKPEPGQIPSCPVPA